MERRTGPMAPAFRFRVDDPTPAESPKHRLFWGRMTPASHSAGALLGIATAFLIAALVPLATSAQEPPAQLQTFQEGVAGYSGTVDTYLAEGDAAISHGDLDSLRWDTDDPSGSGFQALALIRFDDVFGAGAGQVPPGSTIVSATLQYRIYNGGHDADVYAIGTAWDESATYAGFGGAPGARPEDLAGAVGTVRAKTGLYSLDVTANVAAWVVNPSSNQGWLWSPTGTNGVELWSSEASDPSLRPSLTVEFVAPAPSGDADLALSATISASAFGVGDVIGLSFVLTNDGPDVATNVSVISLLPTGLTYASHNADQGSYDPVSGVWSIGSAAVGVALTLDINATIQKAVPTPGLRVAFLADQSSNADAVAVMNLVADEGADMAIVSGDLGYSDGNAQSPFNWDAMVTTALGDDFPLFASIGNHDLPGWADYQQLLQSRLDRVPSAVCQGDLGVQSVCRYEGLTFLLSGAGTLGSGHEAFLREALVADDSVWRVCSWHKNQNVMQVGAKGDDVGWGPYDACREHGAVIATAHAHGYSRTRTLTSMATPTIDEIWSEPGLLGVGEGQSFVFVSALGGRSIRVQVRCLPTSFPYGCDGE